MSSHQVRWLVSLDRPLRSSLFLPLTCASCPSQPEMHKLPGASWATAQGLHYHNDQHLGRQTNVQA